MHKFAIALNFCLLLLLGFMLVKEGLPNGTNLLDLLFMVFYTVVPVVSIFALWNFGGNDWISLYFRCKALEEQRKIDELNASRKS